MKEGISYSFLLNIVILFIFVCFTVVMGVMSYYRAYKAGAIIVESIEKYEGYNCLSKQEISQKLGSITYNVPFNVSCNSKVSGSCEVGDGYVVVVNDLDFNVSVNSSDLDSGKAYGEVMNSSYSCGIHSNLSRDNLKDVKVCSTNKHYQYTIYTYMYFDLPVINSIIKIPFISKSKVLYEFRDFYNFNGEILDSFSIPESSPEEIDYFDTLKWITVDTYSTFTISSLNNIYNFTFNGMSSHGDYNEREILFSMSGDYSNYPSDMRILSALKDTYYYHNNKNFNALFERRPCGYERDY